MEARMAIKGAAWLALGAFAILWGGAPPVAAQTLESDREQLLAAAKEEGSVFWYCSLADVSCRAVTDGFMEKFGIKADYFQSRSGTLVPRFEAEASTGSSPADVIFIGDVRPMKSFVERGYLASFDVLTSDVPVLRHKVFPEEWLRPEYQTVVAMVLPFLISYNKDIADKVPTDWKDFLDPAFAGKLGIYDPRGSDSVMNAWGFLRETYGDDFLTSIAKLNPILYPGGGPASAGVAGGEVAIVGPIYGTNLEAPIASGAPIVPVVPPIASGAEAVVGLNAKAPHPNAARLLLDYMLSEEGNKKLAVALGDASVYPGDPDMPAQFSKPKTLNDTERAEILALLGIR